MERMYYLECEAGIAGDMLVAAMLDLGADKSVLMEVLKSLPVSGYGVEIGRVKKSGIDACDFNVVVDDRESGLDHDMEYLHGDYYYHREQNGRDRHSHRDHRRHDHHDHEHRHISDVFRIIDGGKMTENARRLAKDIFTIVAHAESRAHGIPVEEVHFHEVGAIDSIVDIVSIAVCADNLGINSIIVPYLCEGTGTVRCMHGILPVPVPAVTNIVQEYGIPMKKINVKGEFVTPTGAAAVAAFMDTMALPDTYRIIRTGIGAGKRNYERASLVRLMEIEVFEGKDDTSDTVWRLESDIDDMSGELFGYLMDVLYSAGAKEVHYSPVQMKKNRPGIELVVICDESCRRLIEEIIFTESTTIGIRRVRMERSTLKRTGLRWETKYGMICAKEVKLPDRSIRYYPEYESVKELAERLCIPFYEAWKLAEGEIAERAGV